jgi:hypothetical protein
LEESAVGDRGRQLFHDKDTHVRAPSREPATLADGRR